MERLIPSYTTRFFLSTNVRTIWRAQVPEGQQLCLCSGSYLQRQDRLITVYLLLSFYFFFCVCDRRLDPARIDSRRTRTSFGRQKRVQQRRNKLGHGQIKKASIGGVCETHRTAELTQCDAQRRMTRNYPWTWIRKSLLFTFEIKGRGEAQQQRQVRGDPVERLGDGRDAREKPIN